MKRVLALLLLFTILLSAAPALALQSYYCSSCGKYLSSNDLCSIHPQIYANDRFRAVGQYNPVDVRGIKAKDVQTRINNREYGVYFKFTPGAKDNGFYIRTIDWLVYSPNGEIIQHDHASNVNITCSNKEYWYWNFFSLAEGYRYVYNKYGYVPKGVYTIQVFFNGQFTGSVTTTLH